MFIAKELVASQKYRIKRIKNNNANLVELTLDNVARVEAMIYENSYYKNNKPTSSKSLISQLTNQNYNMRIGDIVAAVDRENSTHLNSYKQGRANVTAIMQKYTLNQIKELLKNINGNFDLFNEIAFPKHRAAGEKDRFSYASKLCHSLCIELLSGTPYEDTYCKYDSVLSKVLPLYYEEYCGTKIKLSDYQNQYSKYIQYVDKIRNAAQKRYDGDEISRNGFDHLLWYCHKG